MIRRLIGAAALACASLMAQIAPAALPCDNKSVQKGVDAFRVVTTRLVFVNCDVVNLTQFETSAILKIVDSDGNATAAPGVSGAVHLFRRGEAWLQIDLVSDKGPQVLTPDQDYQVILAPDHQATVETFDGKMPGPFQPLTILISTKAVATLKPGLVQDLDVEFRVTSPLALRTLTSQPKFAEIILSNVPVYHLAQTRLIGPPVTDCQAAGTCPPPTLPADQSPEIFGTAQIALVSDHLYQPKATLAVTGLNDAFNQPLKIQNDVALAAVPKTKDDSFVYLKLDHQAGAGSKPGFAVEAKFASTLGAPMAGGFFWNPALNLDIGAGSVSSVKVNDTIIPSLGVTRLWRWNSSLQGIRFTPAASVETNREFDKRNLLYDQDVKFFLKYLSATRLQNSWKKYNAMTPQQKKDTTFRPDLANWGASVQLFLGSELGHSIDAVTVKASKGSESVLVPSFAVARIRPKLVAAAEYKRVSFTLSALPRYLFSREYATRESSDGKSIFLIPVSGFRPYGEAGVTIGLDASGHIALNSTYKLGSQPPTYTKVNTVQTGLLLKY